MYFNHKKKTERIQIIYRIPQNITENNKKTKGFPKVEEEMDKNKRFSHVFFINNRNIILLFFMNPPLIDRETIRIKKRGHLKWQTDTNTE